MSEELIVRHCSPTLAGLKTGNMFTCAFKDREDMLISLRRLNRLLGKKGLRVIPLRFKNNKALIYVYRPKLLSRDLQHNIALSLLRQLGYGDETPEKCVSKLRKKLNESEEFPHEIGLFLGYPPEDVCGFIENRATGCKCVGCWKVYGDVAAAEKTFAKYKKCTDVYCNCLKNGGTIERLTIAV